MNISLDLDSNLLANAIDAGICGGIGYWCTKVARSKKQPHTLTFHEDAENGGDGAVFVITRADWSRAVALMAAKSPKAFASMMSDNADADVGDALIQYACFGELKYG